jgi:hypothetical protein
MIRPLSLIGTLLLCVAPAFGSSISLTINPSGLTGAPGDGLTYSGTIVASGDVFLNGICFSFTATPCDDVSSPGPGFFTSDSLNDTFFQNVPGIFQSGDSYTGPVFAVIIDPSAPAGTYSGTVTLLGGADPSAVAPQGSGTFQLVILTPEPASIGYLLLGMALLPFARKRQATSEPRR